MDTRAIIFKWVFYFVGWLGILALIVEKCPAKDLSGIKLYLRENVKTWGKALLMYTGMYVLWANGQGIVAGVKQAEPFLFLFNYKAAAGSFFVAYYINSITRTFEKKAKEKGAVMDETAGG
jgi:hypothetical protein